MPLYLSTCLVLHNICIIFGDDFWKIEWIQEAAEEIHNGMTLRRISGPSSHERLVVANHALQSLAGIEENYRDTLEYMSHEAAKEFQISMNTDGKTFKELCTRRNGIARSLWLAKTKACVVDTFPMDVE